MGAYFDDAEDLASSLDVNAASVQSLWKYCDEASSCSAQVRAVCTQLKQSTALPSSSRQIVPRAKQADELDVSTPSTALVEQETKLRRKRKIPSSLSPANKLWNLLIEAGEQSQYYPEYRDLQQDELQRYRTRWEAMFQSLSHRDVGPRLSAIYRWKAWCANSVSVFTPGPHHLSEWLEIQSKRGPSVAPGLLAMLAWINRSLKTKLPLDSGMMDTFRSLPTLHRPKQQIPFTLKEMAHWETLMIESNNVFVTNVVRSIIIITYGTVRHKHTALSRILGLSDEMIVGTCSKDKAYHQQTGKREGFVWLAPRRGLLNQDLGQLIQDSWRNGLPNDDPLTLGISRDYGPGKDVASATFFRHKALTIDKLTAATAELLQAPPLQLCREDAARAATYRGRRFMNSMGREANLSEPDLASLGNWVGQTDDPSGTQRQIAQSMAVRYSALKLQTAARAKFKCLHALRVASAEYGSFEQDPEALKTCMPSEDLLEHASKSAGIGISKLFPETQVPILNTTRIFPVQPPLRGALLPIEDKDRGADPLPLLDINPDQDEVSKSETSMDSDTDSETERTLQESAEIMYKYAELQWAIPPHKKAKVHFIVEAYPDALISVCNRRLKRVSNTERGLDFLTKSESKICDTCLVAQDLELQQFIYSHYRGSSY